MSDMKTSRDRAPGWLASRLQLRKRIGAGLVIVLPIWITVLVVTLVFRLTRDASLWLVTAVLRSNLGTPLFDRWGLEAQTLARDGFSSLPLTFQWGIGLFSALLTIVLLYMLGAVTANVVGNRMVRIGEAILERVPFVKVIYQATKRVFETFAGGGKRPFKQVVLVPFPTGQIRSIGFVTKAFVDQSTGNPLYSVFMATAPNPTTGSVLIVKQSDVIALDWSIEEAVKVVMSAGVLMPDTVPLTGPGSPAPTT